MTINGISGTGYGMQAGSMGLNRQTDVESRRLQNQIANAQKQLQELAANEELSVEEKSKKRQEIQQEITNLTQQLSLHQMEQRKKQRSEGTAMDDMLGGNDQMRGKRDKAGNTGTQGMSGATMEALISADVSMGQVQVQAGVKSSLEGRAGVLKAEIKQDTALGVGVNTEAKEAALADIEDKVDDVTSAQMSALSDINGKLEEAAKEDGRTEQTDGAEEEDNAAGAEKAGAVAEGDLTDVTGNTAEYVHVDVKL